MFASRICWTQGKKQDNALVGALFALFLVHIVAVRHVAGHVGRLEGLALLDVERLDGLHQLVGNLAGAVHGNVRKIHLSAPVDGIIGGFRVVIVGIAPVPGPGRGEVAVGIRLGVKQPEGHIHTLDFVQMALLPEQLRQKLFPGHMLAQRLLGGLFVQLEGRFPWETTK